MVWLPVWLQLTASLAKWFVYELRGSGFGSSCSHLNFKFRACFEQGVPWHSGNYRVWIHSETRTWYDKTYRHMIWFLKFLVRQGKMPWNHVCINNQNAIVQTLKMIQWETSWDYIASRPYNETQEGSRLLHSGSKHDETEMTSLLCIFLLFHHSCVQNWFSETKLPI